MQLLGSLYIRSGDYTDAIDWLRRAESLQPNARAELLLALAYQHLKQMDLASHYLELAKHRTPDDPDVQRSLAGYYRETGNYAEAIAALKSIRNPKPDVMAELAYTYQLDGKPAESATAIHEAANAMPKDLGLQLSAAQADVAVGSIENADAISPAGRRAWMPTTTACTPSAERSRRLQERDAMPSGNTGRPGSPAREPSRGTALWHPAAHGSDGSLPELKDQDAAQNSWRSRRTESSARRTGSRPNAVSAPASADQDERQRSRQRARRLKEALATQSARSQQPAARRRSADEAREAPTEPSPPIGRFLPSIHATEFALISLGYASRAAGRDQDAEKYFRAPGPSLPFVLCTVSGVGRSVHRAPPITPKRKTPTARGMRWRRTMR